MLSFCPSCNASHEPNAHINKSLQYGSSGVYDQLESNYKQAVPQIFVFGEIEGLSVKDMPFCRNLVSAYATWELLYDDECWTIIEGETTGQTFASDQGEINELYCIWNHPLSIHLQCKDIKKWPKLVIQVKFEDLSSGRHDILGYSQINIPCEAGSFEFVSHVWRPSGETVLDRCRTHLCGGAPEFVDPKRALDIQGELGSKNFPQLSDRWRFASETTGKVVVRLQVLTTDFAEMGILINESSAVRRTAIQSGRGTGSRIAELPSLH